MSAKTIWGKIVSYLRENKQVALYVACGDITDVELEGDNLIVNIQDNMIAILLSEGRREIERAISWQGVNVKLVLNFKEIQKTKQEQDIQRLTELFGSELKIK